MNLEQHNVPDKGWSLVEREVLTATPWMVVAREKIATPSRPEGVPWMVVHRPVAAVIAPRLPDGSFLLIRQERVAVRRETWEFPAGQIEKEVTPEEIEATARRELGEEAGAISPHPLIPLGFFFSSVGFSDECCHLFLATDVEIQPDLRNHDELEAIHEVRAFQPAELREAISSGRIFDANTLAVFARLNAKGWFA